MAYTVKIWSRIEVVGPDGNVIEAIGLRPTDPPVKVNAAGQERFVVEATVADNYTVVNLWTAGDGGVADFDVLVLVSDKDILLELVEDYATTPLYSTVTVTANVPFVLAADDVVNVATATTVSTTSDVIDQINVQRNVADAAGDAQVKLYLFT